MSDTTGGPKTIRLKRPSDTAAMRIAGADRPVMTRVEQAPASAPDISKTSQLEVPPVEEPEEVGESPSATRRKTIRVRQPSGRAGVTSVAVRRPGAEELQATGTEPRPRSAAPPAMFRPDEPSVFFPILASVAIITTCVIIYVLMAQTFGPDISYTRLSYGLPEWDLSWPGKILRTQ
jgi:hypothetical protein